MANVPACSLYEPSKHGYGPCRGDSQHVNQTWYNTASATWVNHCTVSDEVWSENGAAAIYSQTGCRQGRYSYPDETNNACESSQSFCRECQIVKEILPEKQRSLNYNSTKDDFSLTYEKNKIVLAQLWNRIYEILSCIYVYPLPVTEEDVYRRGHRNPEIFSVVEPVQNRDVEYYNRWFIDDGVRGWTTESAYLPVYPDFNKAKSGYKLVNNYRTILTCECNQYQPPRPIEEMTETIYKNYFNKIYLKFVSGEKWPNGDVHNPLGYKDITNFYYPDTTQPDWRRWSSKDTWTWFKNYFIDGKTNGQYNHPDRNYYIIDWNWGKTAYTWDGAFIYPYINRDECYEKLASTEKYVKLKNPDKAEIPSYNKYNFDKSSPAQWVDDINKRLIYIQHDDFINLINNGVTANTDKILFELYQKVLEKLETTVPNGQSAKNTIITEQIIQNIQNIIDNYELYYDRCRICNSYCNAGSCQATYQENYVDVCCQYSVMINGVGGETIAHQGDATGCYTGNADTGFTWWWCTVIQ